MSQLFDDSDTEIEIKTDTEYAKSYDTWRKKEELNKFKARYGESALDVDSDDEDSSEDDETAVELTEEVERDFYKTLALLKKKDPKIYDDKVVFFKEPTENKKTNIKPDKKQTMSLKDYERQLLLEKGGIISDEENEDVKEVSRNWKMDEENQLKKSFAVDEDSDEDVGSLLKAREETEEVKEKKEADYKAWLIGQEEKLKDKEIKSSLKHLKDYWSDPKLDDGEKFLRDCLLNNRYTQADSENKDYIPTYNEIVQDLSEDEDELEKQEEFEHKYNFRFEEPDQEFIKRYPRTIEGSLRREDNRRKLKRQEVKERKAKEKEEKMEDLRKLRDMRRKEIEEKIEKLKEITGNQEIAFNDDDIDGDFDPEAHDRRMQALFNDDYYEDGPEEDIKPPIDLDDDDALELQPENYDNWTGKNEDEGNDAPNCEDDDFNMDAEYDPKAMQRELVDSTRKKKKRKRKSKFVEMLAKDRPKFDPLDSNYEKYIDEYYKFDCEDIIDDVPFKFKYRKVIPNNFGLSVEEILSANDRELNKWCSLKKAVSLRDDHVEKYEQIAYEKKGQNIQLKKKIIPSLFKEEKELEDATEIKSKENGVGTKRNDKEKCGDNNETITKSETTENTSSNPGESPKKKKKQKKRKSSALQEENNSKADNGEQPEKKMKSEEKCEIETDKVSKKQRKKMGNEDTTSTLSHEANINEEKVDNPQNNEKTASKKKKKHKKKNKGANTSTNNQVESNAKKNSEGGNQIEKKDASEQKSGIKRKHSEMSNHQNSNKKFKKNKKDVDIGLSDSRIKAFGLNPKKFKNKVIYGNKNKN